MATDVAIPQPGDGGSAEGGFSRPRRGLVLGGGGVLGAAWTIGALCALEEALDWDPRTADVILGTSAGSIIAAGLALGVRTSELRDHQRGLEVTTGPLRGVRVDYDTWVGGARPMRPGRGIGSPRLLRGLALHPHRIPLQTMIAALLPPGRGPLVGVKSAFSALNPSNAWPAGDALRIVSVDFDSGDRVVFGAPGAPNIGLADAVIASCALPAWFAPVPIDGHRYVDGGVWSETNLDLMAPERLDEVFVLAPTAARTTDQPHGLANRLDRRLRHTASRRVLREAKLVRNAGAEVRIIAPSPADLAVMGANLMDPTRRLTVLETSLRTTAALHPPAATHP
jgi:NTE family protein